MIRVARGARAGRSGEPAKRGRASAIGMRGPMVHQLFYNAQPVALGSPLWAGRGLVWLARGRLFASLCGIGLKDGLPPRRRAGLGAFRIGKEYWRRMCFCRLFARNACVRRGGGCVYGLYYASCSCRTVYIIVLFPYRLGETHALGRLFQREKYRPLGRRLEQTHISQTCSCGARSHFLPHHHHHRTGSPDSPRTKARHQHHIYIPSFSRTHTRHRDGRDDI